MAGELYQDTLQALLGLPLLSMCPLVQEDVLLAFQVCFDLFENEMQAFLLKVENLMPTSAHSNQQMDNFTNLLAR